MIIGGRTLDPYFTSDVLLVSVDSSGILNWHIIFGGGSSEEWGHSIRRTSDGGYIIVVAGDSNVTKTGSQGEVLWARDYEEIGISDARQTPDGGYILAGSSSISGSDEFCLVKTDGLGDTLWTRTYGGTEHAHASCVQITADGGYIVAGTTTVTPPYVNDAYLVKTDATGDSIWSHAYGGSEYEWVYSVEQTSDGGYVIGCATTSFGAGSGDMYLVKTDGVGDTLWTRTYGGTGWETACMIHQTPDSGYILAGVTSSFGSTYALYLVRTDDRGDTLWSLVHVEPFNIHAYDFRPTSDQGYIVVGSLYDELWSGLWIAKISPDTFTYTPEIQVSNSALDFGEVVVGDDQSHGEEVIVSNTGTRRLIILGVSIGDSSFATDYDPSDSLLAPGDSLVITVTFAPQDTISYDDTLRIDNNDELVNVTLHGIGVPPGAVSLEPSSNPPTAFALTPAYPNPFNATTSIGYDIPVRAPIRLEVYDVLGRKVARLVNGRQVAGRYQVVWDAGDLPSGIYFVRMQAGELVQTRKVVLLK